MLLLAGVVILVLGVACGVILLLAPLGLIDAVAGPTIWVLFPVFTIGGYLVAAALADDKQVPMISRASGAILLLLALAAAIVLVLEGGGLMAPRGGSLALWYVLGIGLLLGGVGLASHRRPRPAQEHSAAQSRL